MKEGGGSGTEKGGSGIWQQRVITLATSHALGKLGNVRVALRKVLGALQHVVGYVEER